VSEPLGAESYDRYPKGREDLLVPSAGPILREIAQNDRVDSLEDLGAELNISVSLLEDYAHLHNVSLPVSVESDESPVVQAPDGESGGTIPLNTADLDSDFRVAFHLYVTLQLSVEEIANVCNTDSTAVTRSLQSHNIL
jgi:DNA-directed RNA polymerase specialized sigma24 family protein